MGPWTGGNWAMLVLGGTVIYVSLGQAMNPYRLAGHLLTWKAAVWACCCPHCLLLLLHLLLLLLSTSAAADACPFLACTGWPKLSVGGEGLCQEFCTMKDFGSSWASISPHCLHSCPHTYLPPHPTPPPHTLQPRTTTHTYTHPYNNPVHRWQAGWSSTTDAPARRQTAPRPRRATPSAVRRHGSPK